jgi:hypothetical protein
MGGSTYSHRTTPNKPADTTKPETQDNINGCEDTVADYPPGSPLICKRVNPTGKTAGDTWAAARSNHSGGVVAGRGDGSVGFYTDDINEQIWYNLATRAGADRVEDR